MTIVINFFAGSGCGKSSLASGVFSELKWLGVNVEYVMEYVKHQLFEERTAIFKDQDYIFGKQKYNIKRLVDCDKLDVIVTDSPIILSAFYNKPFDETFNQHVIDEFNKFNNFNYLLERVKPFNEVGRFQTAEEAKQDDIKLRKMLDDYEIKYTDIKGEKASIEIIANQIKNMINYQKQGIAWRS